MLLGLLGCRNLCFYVLILFHHSDGSICFVKSWILEPVDAKILDILFVDGHLGCPSLDQRLLLLNVVGSSPLHFAKPEHDIPCSIAKRSMARHTSSCVIFFSLCYLLEFYPFVLAHLDFIPYLPRKQWAPFPRYKIQKHPSKKYTKKNFDKTLDESIFVYYI